MVISFCEKQAGAAGYPRPRLPNAGLSDSGGALGNPVFEQSGHA
jgi:hypothetical protein